MKRANDTLSVLLAIALTGALAAGFYFAVQYVIGLYNGLDAHLRTIIQTTLAVGLVGAVIVVLAVQWIYRRISVQRQRPRKAEIYQHFLDAWAVVLRGRRAARPPTGSRPPICRSPSGTCCYGPGAICCDTTPTAE